MKSSSVTEISCIATTLILLSSGALLASDLNHTKWRPLFDGKSLDGWEILEDEGKFFVEAAAIVGERPRPKQVSLEELAAWIVVGRTIMNLDEFITKE